MSGTVLRYSARAADTTVLGPGHRAVIWTYGCCFHCAGCVGENYKSGAWREAAPEDMARWYLGLEADGLTVSGGEPFLQPAAVAETVERIRAQRDCGVILYTGFLYEQLLDKAKDDPGVARLLGCTDLLIDGPFIAELSADDLPYRGSANQRIIPLTERYRKDIDEYYKRGPRRIEIRLSEKDQQTMMIGVPSRSQFALWQELKKLGGE